MEQMIGLVINFIVLIASFITIWVNLNLKIQKTTIMIEVLEKKLEDVQQNSNDILTKIEKSNDKIWDKLNKITDMLEIKLQDLAVIKAEHEKLSCRNNNR